MESITRKIIFIILIASFTFSVFGRRFLTDDDDLENGIVTTAKSFDGGEYNCVDIYEQPSLKHPAMQDLQVKERIHKYLANAVAKMQSNIDHLGLSTDQFWIDKGCPIGTVPIPRNTKKKFNIAPPICGTDCNDTLVEFAGIGQEASEKHLYTGASAIISIYNPRVVINQFTCQRRYSSASIFLENGNNQLRVGWIVYPAFFGGDLRTRLYIAWRAEDLEMNTCVNSGCSGFVQVDNKILVGMPFEHVSTIGSSNQHDFFFQVNKQPDGWEFSGGRSEDKPTIVGYLPGFLFNNDMQNFAKRVRFGGQVGACESDKSTPPMGSGQFVDGKFNQTCYMRHVKVRFQDGSLVDPKQASIAQSRCYLAGSNGVVDDSYWKYRLMFGGAGGTRKDCHS